MNVSNIVKQFVAFINNSYDELARLFHSIETEKKNIMLADKIENGIYQFMWETIVEAQICPDGEYLDPYGDGADFYGTSSRVIYPEKLATSKVSVNVKGILDFFSQKYITLENLDLIKFVSSNGKEYFVEKPFDFVLCEDKLYNRFLFKLSEVEFFLVKIDE